MNIIERIREYKSANQAENLTDVRKPALIAEPKSTFVYTRGADVMTTFRKHGFVPPSEVRTDYLFGSNRRRDS